MLMVLSSIGVYSQEAATVVVVLKSGTTITGQVKQLDPTEKIVLSIGGIDTTINMSDVASVTPVSNAATTASADASMGDVIAPALGLPEDTVINICGVDVKFILMRGGKFKYGFDGRGSLSMNSEPVHAVELSPFYVSEEFVSRDLYKAVMKSDYTTDFSINYDHRKDLDESLQQCAFFVSENLWKKKGIPTVESFLSALQPTYGQKFDLPTEVQWFFFESHKTREAASLKTPNLLYCQFAQQVSMTDVVDPLGLATVVKGSTSHDDKDEFETYRLYDRGKTKRTNVQWVDFLNFKLTRKTGVLDAPVCPIRLVMSAKK